MKKLLAILIFLVVAWCVKTTWDIGQLEQRQTALETEQETTEADMWRVFQAESEAMAGIYVRLNNLEREVKDLRRPYLIKRNCHVGT